MYNIDIKDYLQADPLMRTGAVIGYSFHLLLGIVLLFYALKLYYLRVGKISNIKNSSIIHDTLLIIIIPEGIRSLVLTQVYIILAGIIAQKLYMNIETVTTILLGVPSLVNPIIFIVISSLITLRRINLLTNLDRKKWRYILFLLLYLLIAAIVLRIAEILLQVVTYKFPDLQYGIANYRLYFGSTVGGF